MTTHPFQYKIIYSNRKTLAIQVTTTKEVIVRAPRSMSPSRIDAFLTNKESWILKHLNAMEHISESRQQILPESVRKRYIENARAVFTQKVSYYANLMGVTYGRITIREQKTRWGSCSSKGNLNFNWRLIFAPEYVIDYVVVHELAHRKEMNHSRAFYAVIEAVLPDYRIAQKWLKDHGHELWK